MQNATMISRIFYFSFFCFLSFSLFQNFAHANAPEIKSSLFAFSSEEIIEHVTTDARQFAFDGDEVVCGGEISNLKLESSTEEENQPGTYLVTLSTQLSLPVNYCESIETRSCTVTLRIENQTFQTLDWNCHSNIK